jgi:hypothetical protein
VVADALDPEQVAEAVGRARPDVIVHQLTALAGVERYTERDACRVKILWATPAKWIPPSADHPAIP